VDLVPPTRPDEGQKARSETASRGREGASGGDRNDWRQSM